MNKIKPVYFILGVFAALLPISCAARITGSLAANGSANLSVSVALEPQMANLIRRMSRAGGQTDSLILDGPVITQSISRAPGVISALLRNTGPASLEGSINISKASDFLAPGDRRGFIEFEQTSSGGNCKITISRENGPVILSLLSSEIAEYLEAIMAPIATGENLNKANYLSEVTGMYSKAVSDEIAGSRIRASIDFPGSVTSVKGGTFSGRRVEFNIPLLDLLVLETPLTYEVHWN
jgi:hypothetical protein